MLHGTTIQQSLDMSASSVAKADSFDEFYTEVRSLFCKYLKIFSGLVPNQVSNSFAITTMFKVDSSSLV